MSTKYLLLFIVVLIVKGHGAIIGQTNYNDTLCAKFNYDGTVCLQCSFHSFYDNLTQTCMPVNNQCKTWDTNNGKCLTCFDGYGNAITGGLAVNGSCPLFDTSQINSNCQCSFGTSELSICITCIQGFYLDQHHFCKAGIVGCKSHTKSIQTNYMVCQQCSNQYHLTVNRSCILISPFCAITTDDGNCSQCVGNYTLNSMNECVIISPNCALNNLNGNECLVCQEAFYVNSLAQCIPLPTNCQQVAIEGTCTQCIKGWWLSSSNSSNCVQLTPNCIQADENLSCTECDWGYQLSNDLCTDLSGNCAQTTNGTCSLCLPGYKPDSFSVCVSLPVGCMLGNESSVSTNSSSNAPTPANNFTTTYIICLPGWALTANGECFQSLDGCMTSDNATQNQTCGACLQGYYLDSNGKCQYLTQNCNQTNTNGICIRCNTAYVLSLFSSCVPSPGFIVNSTDNSSTNPPFINYDCYQQNSSDLCTSCRANYNLINGSCVPTGQNPLCFAYDNQKNCIDCFYPQKFFLDNNKVCVSRNLYCNGFSFQTGQCTLCYTGWFLIQGECINQLQMITSMATPTFTIIIIVTPRSKKSKK